MAEQPTVNSGESKARRAFYFGCARGINGRRGVGHYLYFPSDDGRVLGEPRGYEAHREVDSLIPWRATPDGTLAPRPKGRHSEAPEGHAALHHKDGWTAISFWDRSGDGRGNSSSTFMFEGTLTFDEALALARATFPALFERFPFEVVEWGPTHAA